jgi:hypothetical protein
MRWTQDNADALAKAAPEIPLAFHNRRRANWRTLLAVAEAGGGDWEKDGWKAALAIEALAAALDPSIGVQLLGAIKGAFEARGTDRITSAGLINDLIADETAPWATYNKGKPISQRQVANLLKAYGIKPKTIRLDDGSFPKGYLLEWFTDVFSRFYGADGAPTSETSFHTSTDLFSQDFSTSTSTSTDPHVEVRKPFENNDVDMWKPKSECPGGFACDGANGEGSERPSVCDLCGEPEHPGDPVQEVYVGDQGPLRLHRRCQSEFLKD